MNRQETEQLFEMVEKVGRILEEDENIERAREALKRMIAEGERIRNSVGKIVAEEHGNRPKPLPVPVYIYDRENSRIPDRLRVSFEDGSTAVYDLQVEQPHPLLVENIRILRKWKMEGYQHVKTTTRRRRTGK